MSMTISVFTPTFNRGYTLHKCFESLQRQTCKDFVWVIVDDGSTDDTKILVTKWKNKADFEIKYIYKENEGMHSAHNVAYQIIDTELNICVDSDDYLADTAIHDIVEFWKENKQQRFAGIIALNQDKNLGVIGTELPDEKSLKIDNYYHKGGRGDKKLIYRTDVIKKYPTYPIFENEKFVPLDVLYLMIDQDYDLLILNKPVCIVEYLDDGSTRNIFKQYVNNPQGFSYARRVYMKYKKGSIRRFKTQLHYISSSIISRNKNFISESECKIGTVLSIPLGVVFHFYIRLKTFTDNSS